MREEAAELQEMPRWRDEVQGETGDRGGRRDRMRLANRIVGAALRASAESLEVCTCGRLNGLALVVVLVSCKRQQRRQRAASCRLWKSPSPTQSVCVC